MTYPHLILKQARRAYEARPSHAAFGRGCPGGSVCPVLALERAWQLQQDTTGGWLKRLEFNRALWELARSAGITKDVPDYVPTPGSEVFREDVIKWNAETSTEDVLAAFDDAIARTA